MKSWPHRTLSSVPPSYIADDLAMDVRLAVFDDEREAQTIRCDLKAICAAGGFHTRFASMSGNSKKHEAFLVPKPDGRFVILVDPLVGSAMSQVTRRHRFRFRIAHEIAHSFFYDRRHHPARRISNSSKDEEMFCDRFASALLIPRQTTAAVPAKPHSVFKLRSVFDVSAQVAARALAISHPDVSVVGMIFSANARSGRDPDWRVTWTAGTRFIPGNARLRSDVVHKAARFGAAESVEELKVGEAKGHFQVSAYLSKGEGQMIVVLTP